MMIEFDYIPGSADELWFLYVSALASRPNQLLLSLLYFAVLLNVRGMSLVISRQIGQATDFVVQMINATVTEDILAQYV